MRIFDMRPMEAPKRPIQSKTISGPRPEKVRKHLCKCGNPARKNDFYCRRCRKEEGARPLPPRTGRSARLVEEHRAIKKATAKIARLSAYISRNELLKKLGLGPSYQQDYLKSSLWKSIRRRQLNSNPNCCRCNDPAEEVHHSMYSRENLLGLSLTGLHSICRHCHEKAEIAIVQGKPRKRTLEMANWLLGIAKRPKVNRGKRRDSRQKLRRHRRASQKR